MINIITAVLNENINYKLREYEDINIKYDDIQYEEGLLEIFEKEKDIINYIVINEKILEKNNIENIIKIINKKNKNINLILLSEKIIENSRTYENLINILCTNNDEKIEEKIIEKIGVKEKKILNKNNTIKYLKEENEKIKEEIKVLKNIIEKNNNIKIKNKIKFIEKIIKKNKKSLEKKNKGNMILVTGVGNTGKTVISSVLGVLLSREKKTLLIDLNFDNKELHNIFGKKLYDAKNDKNIIRNINNNLDIISDMDLVLIDYKNKIVEKLNILFNKLLEKYEYIILDLNDNQEEKIINYFLNKSNKIIFLIEGNLINLRKSKLYYEENLKNINEIENNKLKIVLNKKNKYSINKEIIEKIFKNKIFDQIRYNSQFNKFINSNGKYHLKSIGIKNILMKIKEE